MAVTTTFTKGSTVEVCSDDVGFEGSWYVATLVDVTEPSLTNNKTSNNKSRSKKYTAFMVEYATLFKDDDSDEHLTELVDPAFVRPVPPRNPRRNYDNELETEEGDDDFELNDVVDAYHRDGWWIGVVNNVIVEGEIKKYVVSFDSPPEKVEFERSQLRLHVDWIDGRWKVPPMQTPSKGALTTDLDNLNAGSLVSAKRKCQSRKKAETDGKTAGDVEKSHGSKGNTEVMVSAVEAGGSTITMGTPETEDGKSRTKRKRGRPEKLTIRRQNGLLEDNQEAGNGNHEVTSELDNQPLSVWYQGLHPLSVLKRSSCCSTLDHHDNQIGALNQAIIKNSQTTVYQQELPFIKKSPIWATIESLEVYQKPPQKPHFSPLKDAKEDYREGLAIAHMVTFANVAQRTSKLQWTDPNNVFENSLEALVDLETYGFDVGAVRARLTELLSTKALVSQLEEDLKEAEKEIERRNREKTVIDKEIYEVELKMQELQDKLAQNLMTKNVKDAEITMLRTNLQVVTKRMKDQKLAFNILASSPL